MSATSSASPHISPNTRSCDSSTYQSNNNNNNNNNDNKFSNKNQKRKNSIEKSNQNDEYDLDNDDEQDDMQARKYNKLLNENLNKVKTSEQFEPYTMTKAKTETCKGALDLNEIECFLETDDLWKKFHELGTEMIITKSGRRMFPPLRVSFGGARLNQKYIIAMDIVPTDSKRYRYAYHRSSWLVAGKADPPVQSRLFIHPDGPFTGESLFKQIVSFEKVKLTNNEMDKCGHIVLNSMHKYQPRVHLIKKPDENSKISNSQFRLQVSNDLENFEYKTFLFPETSFIAVTAYQNQLVIIL